MIRHSEIGDRAADPYRVVFGFKHTIVDLSDHPVSTGEWKGEPLPDSMCIAAGLNPPCKSTAAGAYQITHPTWEGLKALGKLPDFSQASQDDAAVMLIRNARALDMVFAGQVGDAITACRGIWASLPGSNVGQPTRTFADLINVYANQGGAFA